MTGWILFGILLLIMLTIISGKSESQKKCDKRIKHLQDLNNNLRIEKDKLSEKLDGTISQRDIFKGFYRF